MSDDKIEQQGLMKLYVPQREFSLLPKSLGEAREMALMIANSTFAPKAYIQNPDAVLIAVQMGADLGLKPMQALQNIAVINGRPSIWGDAALALAMPALSRFKEHLTGSGDDMAAVCTLQRKGWPDETVRIFTVQDAKTARLWGKEGPWTNYPKRMLQMRARSFALRDSCADLLMGLILAEEAMDYPEAIESTAVSVVEVETEKERDPLDLIPEGMRDNVEKAFAALNYGAGQRLAKINEFLRKPDVTPEDGTTALLEWCRDEFSRRKTGAPRKRSSNAKKAEKEDAPVSPAPTTDESAPVSPAATTDESAPKTEQQALKADLQAQIDAVVAKPAVPVVNTPVTESEPAPPTAAEIPWGNQGQTKQPEEGELF